MLALEELLEDCTQVLFIFTEKDSDLFIHETFIF